MQLELGGPASENSWSTLSDSEFLQSIVWKRGTASEFTRPAKKGDVSAFVAGLVSYWRDNAESNTPARSIPCEATWSLAAFHPSARELALAEAFAHAAPVAPKTKNKKQHTNGAKVDALEQWWEQADVAASPLTMWEYLALLETYPSRVSHLSSPVAFAIWRTLVTMALDLNGLARIVEVKTGDDPPDEEMARYGYRADPFLDLSLLRNCELSWLAGVVLSPIKGADKLRKLGAELLEHELVERTDENGVPHADLLPRLPLWLAVSTRILLNAERRQITLWDEDAAELYRTFVEKAAPLIRPDGRFALSHVQMADPLSFAEVVLKASGWTESQAAVKSLLARPKQAAKATGSSKNGTARRSTPELCIAPVSQSDEAAWAVLRTHWGARADRCTVAHDQPQVIIELTVQGQPVLEGEWYSEINLGNKPTPLHGDWTCVCWQTDDDADYVELQLTLDGIVLSERQVLLSRTRQFCFIAESLSGIQTEQFQYRSRLPLLGGVKGMTSSATREVQLVAGNVPIRAFPIALPDQHVHSTPGRFGPDLSLQTTARGSAWYNPILIDWSPARRSAAALWKSLTVAEEQKIVQPDVAAGHRIKVGNHQWLIYRSLKQTIEARSLLGHQTRYETVIGSVENNGEITPLMLVEY